MTQAEVLSAITDGWLGKAVGAPGAGSTGEHVDGQAVPDLTTVGPEHWVPALRALTTRRARWAAVHTLEEEHKPLVSRYVNELPLRVPGVAAAKTAKDEPPPRPFPTYVVADRRRANRQVSFRLTEEEHDALGLVAGRLGLTPAGLARSFCRAGLNAALEEDERS